MPQWDDNVAGLPDREKELRLLALQVSALTSGGAVHNVKDFGAVGDGVTDDTAAIRLAQAAAYTSGRHLYFPTGSYYISSTLTVQGPGTFGNGQTDHWIGDGRFNSLIVWHGAANGTMLTTVDATRTTQYCTFEGIGFNGNNVADYGASLTAIHWFRFERCDFNFCNISPFRMLGSRNASGVIDSTHPGDSTYCTFDTCSFGRGTYCVQLTGTGGATRTGQGACNMNYFADCFFFTGTSSCFLLDSGAGNTLIRCSFQPGTGNQDGLTINWYGNTIINPVTETYTTGINLQSDVYAECHDNTILGPHDGGTTNPGPVLYRDPNQWNVKLGGSGSGSSPRSGLHLPKQVVAPAIAGAIYRDTNGIPRYWDGATGVSLTNGERKALVDKAWGPIATSFDPKDATTGSQTPTSQTIFAVPVGLRIGDVVSKIGVVVTVAGAGTAPAKVQAGIADKNGVMLQSSGNVSGQFTSIGKVECALGGNYTVLADDFYYLVFLQNGVWGTTQMTVLRATALPSNVVEPWTTGGVSFLLGTQTAQTTLPTTGNSLALTAGLTNIFMAALGTPTA